MVSSEMPEPIATEFRKTYEEQNLGLSLKLALENLVERVPVLDQPPDQLHNLGNRLRGQGLQVGPAQGRALLDQTRAGRSS